MTPSGTVLTRSDLLAQSVNRNLIARRSLGVLVAVTATVLLLVAQPARTTEITLFAGFSALAYVNYLCGARDVLYPAFTFTAIWAVVAAAYYLSPIEIDHLGAKTVAIFLGSGSCFSIGSFAGNRPILSPARFERGAKTEYPDNPNVRLALLAYVVLVVPLFVLDTARIAGGMSISPMFLVNLRAAIVTSFLDGINPYSSKLVSTAPMVAVLTVWVLIMEDKRKWTISLCFACAVLLSLLETGRTTLMQMLCGSLCIVMLRRKNRSLTKTSVHLGIAALGVITLMTVISLLTKIDTQGSDRLAVATTLTVQYVAGPLAAFNHAVYHPELSKGQPASTFAEILIPLSKLGAIRYTAPAAIDQYVDVPFPTNVYTGLKPYFDDFGVVGCLVAFALIGFVEGHLFYGAVHRSQIATFFFVFLSYALMFSTFDDAYHQWMRYAYVAGYVLTYFVVFKRIRVKL